MFTLLTAGTLAGCGSDGSALDEFLGTWSTVDTTANFGPVMCNLPGGTLGPISFSLWGNLMTFQPGTLVDLIETTGICPFGFDVAGKIATVPGTNPYPNQAPCRLDISLSTAPGTEFLEFRPTTLEFDLLQPTKGEAAPAHLHGDSNIIYVAVDPTGLETPSSTACQTYSVDAHLFKLATH